MIESGNLRQYHHLSAHPEIRNNFVKLKGCDVCLQLKVPDYKIDSEPVELSIHENKDDGTKYLSKALRSHLDFRLSITPKPEKHDSVPLQRSIAAVNTISLFFPDIRLESLTICMAAWLETLCAVDDLLENMNLEDAADAIEEVIAVLRDEPIHTPRHPPVMKIITKFKDHCRAHHHPSLLAGFFAEIRTVFTGLLQETHLKKGTLSQTLDTYLSIRRKTIGIKPLCALIRSAYNQPYPFTEEVTQLQNDISLVAGLQNDLIGLEKDIRTGEEMNAAVFLMGGTGTKKARNGVVGSEEVRAATGEICRLHDLYMERAMEKFEGLDARARGVPGLELEAALAGLEVMLMQMHFEWCTSAKRYQAKVV